METALCSHMAAVHFFTDTIRNQCPYVGYTCSNFDDFDGGKCGLQCDGNKYQCNRMGYWTSASEGRGDLYLKTQDASSHPYCSNDEPLRTMEPSDVVFSSKSSTTKSPWSPAMSTLKRAVK